MRKKKISNLVAQKCECTEHQTIHLKMAKFYVNFIIIKIKDNTCGMLCNLRSVSHSTLGFLKSGSSLFSSLFQECGILQGTERVLRDCSGVSKQKPTPTHTCAHTLTTTPYITERTALTTPDPSNGCSCDLMNETLVT